MNAIQPATPPLSQLALPHPEHRPGPRPQALGSATDTSPADELDNPAALKKAFAERCNWQALATVLRGLLKEAVDTGQGDRHRDVEQLLSGRTLSVCEDSDYYQQHPLPPARSVVDLRTYLNGSGLPVPTRMDDLLALYQLATRHAQTHPLGNFSGALSWPLPLNTHDRQTIIDLLDEPGSTLSGLPLAARNKGVLGYLLADSDLANIDLKKTSNATEALLGSARAQALGKVIQSRLGGIATPASVNDYLLAAIQLSLDPESLGTPARNSVAGFDLGQRQHWGKPAVEVIERLSRHLVVHGRTTAAAADLAARVLLARVAPQHLVKDIPPSVTYGSIPWTQLTIAAARLEAQSPGRVLTMSYSEVLAAAESVDVDAALIQRIQRDALNDWAAVNGLLNTDPPPTDAQIRQRFITRQEHLQATATALATPVPEREAMALELLRAQFPGVADSVFKAQSLVKASLREGRPARFPGEHSMLDIVMQGDTVVHDKAEHWVTNDPRIPIQAFCDKSASGKLTVADAFTEGYRQAIATLEQGHAGLTRYLISTLPPQDRQNLEYGALEFFHTHEYKIGLDFSTKTLSKRGHTLDVKTTRNGQVNVYRIDTRAGTITQHNYLATRYSPPYAGLETRHASTLYKTVAFKPFEDEHTEHAREAIAASDTPQVFDSARTDYIAKVFARSLDLHNDDLLHHARGMNSYDLSAAGDDAVGEFLLNLIPLRSATVNFMHGHVADGLLDLGLDAIGLVTLGIGKAGQAGKAFAKGVTSVAGATKAARFLGTVAAEALNPLSGTGDLLRRTGALVRSGASVGRQAIHALRGASGSYDMLKAAGTQHGLAAVGSYRAGDLHLEGAAVFRKGQWHAYDAVKGLPYGAPLERFQPAVAATGADVRVLQSPSLLDYEVRVEPEGLRVKGLQANVYAGPGNKEYVKIDGRLYQSRLEDGQRVILHPTAGSASIAVRDLGGAGWEPSATAQRLLGGQPDTLPKWKLDQNTYIVPIDDIKIRTNSANPYTLNYNGINHIVSFDGQVGAWRGGVDTDGKTPLYFWRSAKNKWQLGTLAKMKQARQLDAHSFRFIDAPSPAVLEAPKNVRAIPRQVHYFWAGGDIPAAMVSNMAKNAEKMPGFTSLVHVDADTPAQFQAIKRRLAADAPGLTVVNLQEEGFFQSLQNTDMYAYFRRGQGKNLAAASDVARYPMMNTYGGIYLDTDDLIQGAVGLPGLTAGDSDVMVSRPVTHKLSHYRPFFNTSNFATQADNPVIAEMIAEMNRRFTLNKTYFETSRPTTTRNASGTVDYTPEFLAYEGRIFETVGPTLFDDVLKSRRPDIYDIGFDGVNKETQQINGRLQPGKVFDLENHILEYYASKGISAPEGLQQRIQAARQHYLTFREQLQIKVGGAHSWIDS